jgi:hypothetical protein
MTDLEEEVGEYFAFLDGLRESGETNMYGASAYLEDEFKMKRWDARKVLTAWMKSYDGENTINDRVAKVIDELGE